MLWLLSSAAYAATLTLGSLSAGDLVITEIHVAPAATTTSRGQWFEVYNDAGSPVDLSGLVVSDGGSQSFTVTGSLVVAAGDWAVFATRSSSSLNGGLPAVDYVYSTTSYSLPAGSKALRLSYGGTTFDSVSFGGVSFPDEYGAAMSLEPSLLDASSNDTGSNWCPAASSYGDGDYGTPGAANDDCPVDLSTLGVGDLVISEVMHDPAASAYNKGEWFEIYNASGVYIDLDGLTVDSGTGKTLVLSGETLLRPGAYAILAARSTAAYNGGLPWVDYRYVYGTELTLEDTDSLALSYGLTTFDEASWNPSDYAGGSGVANQLNSGLLSAVSNDSSANWCAATDVYGAGDYGTPGTVNTDCDTDTDNDGYTEDVDCDDTDADINPGAAELCDGIDNDCNDLIDDSPADGTTYYADADGDFYGNAGSTVVACTKPSGYRTNGLDCNDASASINPGAVETCDGTDNNCSGNENDATNAASWYTDSDSDGYGNPASVTAACTQPSGYIADGTDCNDASASVYPGAAETCNGVDNNCSGSEDDAADAVTYYADVDKDFYGDPASTRTACSRPSGYRTNGLDCNDANASIKPGAAETCDGTDNNCSGNENDASDAASWYPDSDSDGFGAITTATKACTQPSGYLASSTDCNDANASVYPGAAETCDGTDNNCSGNENDASDASTYYADTDYDFYGDAGNTTVACARPSGYRTNGLDCNDASASINPGAAETCDGTDNNCSGDESDASDALSWYPDGDSDGFGAITTATASCTQPSGYLADSTDCDDTSASVYPGADEVCDSVDNDCDSLVDNSPTDGSTYYADTDYDFYGDAGNTTVACARPSGYRTNGLDCNDADAGVNPGAAETCDGTDSNCSGDENDASDALTWYADADSDTYGDLGSTTPACTQPSGYVADSTDCDDTSASVNPGAEDICNDSIDQDCDGEDYGTCDASLADLDGQIYGASASDQIGGNIVSVGDLDGDASGDFAIASASAVYLFDGASSWAGQSTTADAPVVLTGGSGGVSGGDIDGDGYDDLLVGATTLDTNGTDSGGGYVIYGPLSGTISLTTSADETLLGGAAGDATGSNALVLGDVNSDGYDDLLITASGDDTNGTDSGAAYLLFGPPSSGNLFAVADAIYTSDTTKDYLGRGAAVVGDVDADGSPDVMINAYREDRVIEGNTFLNVGATYLLTDFTTGTQDVATAAAAVVYGENALDQTGSVIAPAGDVDGDGYDDVLLASWYADPSSRTDAGEAYLLLGPLSGELSVADAQARLPGAAAGDAAGRSLAGLGDINGDSAGDIMVGAKLADDSGTDAGAVYMVLGPLSGTIDLSLSDAVFTGEAADDRAGMAIAVIPDQNSGGQDDILVGATLNDTEATDSGAVYLIFSERW